MTCAYLLIGVDHVHHICILCAFILFMHFMHHTGSAEEIQTQSVLEEPSPEDNLTEEAGGIDADELPECRDHRPSDFEKGKPRSILTPTVCKCFLINLMMDVALGYRN